MAAQRFLKVYSSISKPVSMILHSVSALRDLLWVQPSSPSVPLAAQSLLPSQLVLLQQLRLLPLALAAPVQLEPILNLAWELVESSFSPEFSLLAVTF